MTDFCSNLIWIGNSKPPLFLSYARNTKWFGKAADVADNTRWPFVFCNRKLKAPFLLLPAGNCELPAPTKTCRREWVNHYATLSIYFLPDFTFFLFLLLFIRLIVCWLCTLFHFNEALRSYCFCGDRLSNEFPNLIIIRIFRLILFDCPSYVGIYCLVEKLILSASI